jgi:AraC-like DNA-binding protein
MPPESALKNSFLIPLVSKIFQDLQVSASICQGEHWFGVHHAPNVMPFELDHGALAERFAYNERSLRQAARGESVLGRHGGLCDLFVPILANGRPEAFIVTGPFVTERPSADELLARFRSLVGRQGQPADPEFSRFLELSLDTLVLGPSELAAFRRLMDCLALLLAGEPATPSLGQQVERLLTALNRTRFVERVWGIAAEMVDERTARGWSSYYQFALRNAIGLSRFPEDVVVGLFVNEADEGHAVDDLIRRNAFQRACVELAAKQGETIGGQIGGYGMTFLSAAGGSPATRRRRLELLTQNARRLADKDFGLRLHLGISSAGAPLPRQYHLALAAAEAALARNEPFLHAEPGTAPNSSLRRMREDLVRTAERQPDALPARFEAFLETVAARSVYRREAVSVELEVAFERVASALLASGALEPKSFEAMHAKLGRAAAEAGTNAELYVTFRQAVLDLVEATKRPSPARHDRNLRGADEYIAEHFAEPLTVKQVAQVAGFAQSYFFDLFQKRHGVTFVKYLTQLRIDRAKELLTSTTFTLERIAELTGLSNQSYLSRVFKRWTGESPADYRARVRPRTAKSGGRLRIHTK